jgi:hypothetical protein
LLGWQGVYVLCTLHGKAVSTHSFAIPCKHTQLWMHVLLLAFVMVILSAAVLTPCAMLPAALLIVPDTSQYGPASFALQPEYCSGMSHSVSAMPQLLRHCLQSTPASLPAVILFVLGFASRGFTWVHGALFAAMIASTDALAATAILKAGEEVVQALAVVMMAQADCRCDCCRFAAAHPSCRPCCVHTAAGGGPDKLVALMEAEALLNDASGVKAGPRVSGMLGSACHACPQPAAPTFTRVLLHQPLHSPLCPAASHHPV